MNFKTFIQTVSECPEDERDAIIREYTTSQRAAFSDRIASVCEALMASYDVPVGLNIIVSFDRGDEAEVHTIQRISDVEDEVKTKLAAGLRIGIRERVYKDIVNNRDLFAKVDQFAKEMEEMAQSDD